MVRLVCLTTAKSPNSSVPVDAAAVSSSAVVLELEKQLLAARTEATSLSSQFAVLKEQNAELVKEVATLKAQKRVLVKEIRASRLRPHDPAGHHASDRHGGGYDGGDGDVDGTPAGNRCVIRQRYAPL